MPTVSEQPTVSVIVPTYDRADVLPRTIESVLAQTFTEFELLVVDDASTDETEAVVTGYDDPRVQYVAHERNRGGSAARNTGIDRAAGEYVAFLDSDDRWRPRKLERQVALLESRSPDWVAAYCGVERVFEDRLGPAKRWLADLLRRDASAANPEGGAELIGAVLADDLHTSAGSTLLVRRETVEAVDGFDESFDRFQDPEFLVRVLAQGKLACADEPLVERYASGSPDADATRAANIHYRETFSATIARFEAQGRDITAAHHLLLAKCYLREGRFRTALRYLRNARRPAPGQYPGLALTACSGVGARVLEGT